VDRFSETGCERGGRPVSSSVSDSTSESSPLPVIPIQDLELGGDQLVYTLGPCVMESEDFVWSMARELKKVTESIGVGFIFKASFDKANRSSIDSFRGMDCRQGCEILGAVGKELNLPVTTDIHLPEQAEVAAEWIDVLQIPAFLCRQTDLIQAAAETGRVVGVKKGQFLAPWDMANIADKLRHFGCKNFFFTERGTSFGYNNLVADMRSIVWMREQGVRVVFDATHSVQRPGGLGGTSGGDGVLAPVLAQAAVATGCDGVFMETHPDPAKALSDGPNQVPLSDLAGVLKKLQRIREAVSL